MKNIICKECGAIFTVEEEMPAYLECICKSTSFELQEPQLLIA